MRYTNGKDALPPELLAEVQKYLCGEMLYIPKKDENKASWGQVSGYREQVMIRNLSIVERYQQGHLVGELVKQFCLSEASIRKIIYNNKSDI